MAFSSGGSGGGPMAEINVTPLVDVMLVLLIIFMITAPLMSHKIASTCRRRMPKPSRTTNPPSRSIWRSRHPASSTGTTSRSPRRSCRRSCASPRRRRPQPELQIRADKDTEYQMIATGHGRCEERGHGQDRLHHHRRRRPVKRSPTRRKKGAAATQRLFFYSFALREKGGAQRRMRVVWTRARQRLHGHPNLHCIRLAKGP